MRSRFGGPQLLATLALLLAFGCVSVSSSVLNDRSERPVSPQSVYVFLPDEETPESCERVAILHGSGSQDYTNESQMLDRLREEAGKLGANAVHLQTMEDAGTGERVVGALFGTGVDRDADALALYCPEDGEGKEGANPPGAPEASVDGGTDR